MKISQRYIDIAIRIRKNYLKEIYLLESKSQKILFYKNSIQEIQSEIENTFKKFKDDPKKKDQIIQEINSKLSKADQELEGVKQEIKPHYEKIEELREESDKLYTILREKYPDITVDELKKQIMEHINE